MPVNYNTEQILYTINHVFLPPKLPQENEQNGVKDHTIAAIVVDSARAFRGVGLQGEELTYWNIFLRLLCQFRDVHKDNVLDVKDVKKALKGLSSHGPTIQLPSDPFDSPAQYFNQELANFLVEMNNEVPFEDNSRERRTSLNTGGGMNGQAAQVTRINKRFGDEPLGGGKNSATGWRRSSAYLVLRVAMQTTLMQRDPTHRLYKEFMVFFHAIIIEHALKNNFNSDLLFCIRAKMSRRLAKLAMTGDVRDFVTRRVDGVCQQVEAELQRRWTHIQENTLTPPSVLETPWNPENLYVDIAVNMQLTNSEACINIALDPTAAPPATLSTFEPTQESCLWDLINFHNVTLKSFKDAFDRDPFFALADFKILVGCGPMNDWVETKLAAPQKFVKEQAIRHLWLYLYTYHTNTLKHYKDNPEELSLMVLTEIELWAAIDKLACSVIPMLSEYTPEIPAETGHGLLKHLLLWKAVDLERAKKAAAYILQRKQNIAHGSVFLDDMDMQSTRARIEEEATQTRNVVLAELREKNRRRNELLTRAASMEHKHNDDTELYDHVRRGKRTRYEHVGWKCARCKLEKEAKGLRASTHEWPLPEDEAEIKQVLFELKVPKSFALWRAATTLLLLEIIMPEEKKKDFDSQHPRVTLTSCTQLGDFCVPGDDEFNVVTLASKLRQQIQLWFRCQPRRTKSACLAA
ncbi:hypothetical protein AAF712_005759 [Marasmius tenuissimus]|uniref:DUF6606 domain-containing protein n=1 Tax=Marasmius tenuissimus TaxID=585030 RepID=A0ABR3A1D4_9AGAR